MIIYKLAMKRFGVLLFVGVLATVSAAQLWPAARDVRTEDHNGDGRPDVWRHYDHSGQLTDVAVDTNFDGRADVHERYDRGALIRRESDRNYDDRIDLVEEFDAATHEHVKSVIDVDYDGGADLLVLFHDGRPVLAEHARALAVNLRRGPENGGGASHVVRRAAGGPPLPLADPFRSEAVVQGTRTGVAPSADAIGLTTSGGLPSDDVHIVSPHVASTSLATAVLQPAGLVSLLPRSPRGPPLS